MLVHKRVNKMVGHVIILFVTFSVSSIKSSGQTQKIDSLKSLLNIRMGGEYADVLYELARAYGDSDYELCFKFASEAFEVAKKSGDTLRIVKTARTKSFAFRRLDKIDSSLILSLKILPIARRNNYLTELKSILNGLAVSYISKAHYDKALKCLFESLSLREASEKFEISGDFLNIGLVYYKLGDFDKALSYYENSLKLKKQITNKYSLDILMINISLCYAHKNSFREAKKFIDQGFSVCGNNCSEYFQLSAYYSLGVIALRQENFIQAKNEFLRSYSLAKKGNNERFILDNIHYLLRIFIRQNQFQQAEEYLKEAELLIAGSTAFNLEIMELYTELSTAYGKLKNFEKKAFYQSKYIALRDSILNEQTIINLMKLESEYLERENKSKIDSQSKILALNNEVIFRQRIGNVSIGLVALLITVLAIVLQKSNKQKKIANRLLDEKVKERTHELEMNRDSLQRAWQERNALITKASTDINSSIATMKGLCFLGIKDIDHPKATQYLNKMDSTSDQLAEILNKMFYSYKINDASR